MVRFLFCAWPFPGHFYPNIAIAHALRERGHHCAFYTGTRARAVIEAEGFPCFPFAAVDEEHICGTLLSPDRPVMRIDRPSVLRQLLQMWLADSIPGQVQDLESLLAEWPADVIVADPTLWAPMLVLYETLRIPIAVSSFVPGCLLPGPDAPPFGFGLPRPRTWPLKLLAQTATLAADLTAGGFRKRINAMRARYGLPPLTLSVTEYVGQMPLYLVPSAPEFDYERRDLPPSVRYVGPCLWDKPGNEASPAWLMELPRDVPWVHVSEGTMHAQKPILLASATQGLAPLRVQVIMTAGTNRELRDLDLGPLPPNVRLARWISHSEILPLTSVLVTTGGAGTVLASLSAGVPLVVVPTEWDKPDNAQRVVEAGAGLRLAPRHCTPARLRSAVEQVLSDPSFRNNARRLAAVFARYRGPVEAACLLEQLASPRLFPGEVRRCSPPN